MTIKTKEPKKEKKIKTEKIDKEKIVKKAASKASNTLKEKKISTARPKANSKILDISKTESKPKTSAKKSVTKTTKKPTVKKEKKTASKKAISKREPAVIEYYNLPYRYNETIVKILYQTPDTLFVYWDISDSDRENYIKQYGKNFFNITYPVLVIHNDTMNYSFELPINDFANSWYIKVNDSKCDYRVELGRRPKYNDASAIEEIKEKVQTEYIYVSTSNEIELPNDHILFTTNSNNTIKYRNVKTKQEKNISIYDIIKDLPLIDNSEIPLFNKEILEGLYSAIYKNEDTSFFERINNPSSGNSSSSMPHS